MLVKLKDYSKSDAPLLIKDALDKLEAKDGPGIEEAREKFINSAY